MRIDDMIECIQNGRRQDAYHEWALYGSERVKYAIAVAGYEAETLVHDDDVRVRRAVLQRHPKYIRKYMNDREWLTDITLAVSQDKHVDEDILECLAELWEEKSSPVAGNIHWKLEAMRYEPSVLEKTMTRAKLYTAGVPIWASDMTLNELATMRYDMGHEAMTAEEWLDNYTAER